MYEFTIILSTLFVTHVIKKLMKHFKPWKIEYIKEYEHKTDPDRKMLQVYFVKRK